MFSSYPASHSLNLVALVAAVLIVAGCGGSGDSTTDASVMMPDGGVPNPDAAIEGPHVVSTTPASGAQGVSEDTVFVFVFSEAMDFSTLRRIVVNAPRVASTSGRGAHPRRAQLLPQRRRDRIRADRRGQSRPARVGRKMTMAESPVDS